MSKQVLSAEQMQHLQELGLSFKPTMLCYVRSRLIEDEEWGLKIFKDLPSDMFEQIPAYTLSDVIDILPKSITSGDDCYYLSLCVDSEGFWCASYDNLDKGGSLEYVNDETPINASYKLLCWAIDKGYIETNKE